MLVSRVRLSVLILAALAMPTAPARESRVSATARVGGNYQLVNETIDAGGGHSEGGAYALDATIGQPDAAQRLDGDSYTVTGGFWRGAEGVVVDTVFAHGFEGP